MTLLAFTYMPVHGENERESRYKALQVKLQHYLPLWTTATEEQQGSFLHLIF